MDAQNPSVLYAGIWKFQRRPWTFVSGGDEDGLYKSTDGGDDVDEARRARPAARHRWAASASRSRRATAIASTR